MPFAVRRVPSSGSTATSTAGPWPSPTSSPLKSIGASSFSPSPITTTPSIETVSRIARMPSTAAWSAAILSPRPTQRPAPSAAASVTRTSSSARFRSGARADTSLSPAEARAVFLEADNRTGREREKEDQTHPRSVAEAAEFQPVEAAPVKVDEAGHSENGGESSKEHAEERRAGCPPDSGRPDQLDEDERNDSFAAHDHELNFPPREGCGGQAAGVT